MVEVILLLVWARPCPTWLVRQVEKCMPKGFTGSLLVLSGCGSRARLVVQTPVGPALFLLRREFQQYADLPRKSLGCIRFLSRRLRGVRLSSSRMRANGV